MCINPIIKKCSVNDCYNIYHNLLESDIKCKDCGSELIILPYNIYWKDEKYYDEFFQFDYNTREFYKPAKYGVQLKLECVNL